ncbi:hypothetical protein AVEN_254175-1 [Araneus ventricosus]|uniref:Uncharacterized protein n=1 Tax=Araneus ventricosus TaxID=182803 RepID=A0A4Y2PX46_ARAVE|nr:hypothetical protein AVEN_254175-1 [Araneus ventricosus]
MITLLSAETDALLKNMVDPEKPKDKGFHKLTAILEKQLNTKPLVISKRFRLHKRNQAEGDTVSEFCGPAEETFNNL